MVSDVVVVVWVRSLATRSTNELAAAAADGGGRSSGQCFTGKIIITILLVTVGAVVGAERGWMGTSSPTAVAVVVVESNDLTRRIKKAERSEQMRSLRSVG